MCSTTYKHIQSRSNATLKLISKSLKDSVMLLYDNEIMQNIVIHTVLNHVLKHNNLAAGSLRNIAF